LLEFFWSFSTSAFSRARIVLRPLRDTIDGRHGNRSVVFLARLREVALRLVDQTAAV